MNLEPGMRIRCVDAGGFQNVVEGREYVVQDCPWFGDIQSVQTCFGGSYYLARRFKPIVRVKAPSRPGCCNKACNGCPDFAFRVRLHRFATSGDLA